MAVSKFVMLALRALTYMEPEAKDYRLERLFQSLTHPTLPALYSIWEHRVLSRDGYEIPMRVFYPSVMESEEILVFFHGGGWVSGTIDTYSRTCAGLANSIGRRVVSVDYRLAPEFPFPTGLEDCYAAVRELNLHREIFHTAVPSVVLAGDSAGGNLSAAVSLLAAERGEFSVDKQILIYPAVYYDHTAGSPFPSVKENGEGYLLTAKKVQEYMELYSPDPNQRKSPYVAPILAEDLSGQPETLIITAEFDPLRDEGEAFGDKLRKAGCTVWVKRFPHMPHGFFSLPLRFAPVRRCCAYMKYFLDGTIGEMENGEEAGL